MNTANKKYRVYRVTGDTVWNLGRFTARQIRRMRRDGILAPAPF